MSKAIAAERLIDDLLIACAPLAGITKAFDLKDGLYLQWRYRKENKNGPFAGDSLWKVNKIKRDAQAAMDKALNAAMKSWPPASSEKELLYFKAEAIRLAIEIFSERRVANLNESEQEAERADEFMEFIESYFSELP